MLVISALLAQLMSLEIRQNSCLERAIYTFFCFAFSMVSVNFSVCSIAFVTYLLNGVPYQFCCNGDFCTYSDWMHFPMLQLCCPFLFNETVTHSRDVAGTLLLHCFCTARVLDRIAKYLQTLHCTRAAPHKNKIPKIWRQKYIAWIWWFAGEVPVLKSHNLIKQSLFDSSVLIAQCPFAWNPINKLSWSWKELVY